MQKLLVPLVVSVLGAAIGPAVLAGTRAEDPMTLNQQGRWNEAADVAERMLAGPDELAPRKRCETRSMLIYAYVQTGRNGEARKQLPLFDAECGSFSEVMWFRKEVERFRSILDPPDGPRPTVRNDDGWRSGDAKKLGLDAAALAEHQTYCEVSGADACLVAYRGSIVQEWYGPGYLEPMPSMSSVKSWTALLAGLLIAEGKLGLDDSVAKYIPEWKAGADAGVTVRQLLSMTSGLRNRKPDEPHVGRVDDKNTFVFALELDYPPGRRWAYSNEGAQLLSPILERAAGTPLERYAEAHLFAPLEMRDTALRLDRKENPWTYADAKTTLRDFAKICQLVIDGGRWGGKQVVPESWVHEIAKPLAQNAEYGLLWWLELGPKVVATRGHLNTDCYAMPELGLVVARMQHRADRNATTRYGDARMTPQLKKLFRRIVGPQQVEPS